MQFKLLKEAALKCLEEQDAITENWNGDSSIKRTHAPMDAPSYYDRDAIEGYFKSHPDYVRKLRDLRKQTNLEDRFHEWLKGTSSNTLYAILANKKEIPREFMEDAEGYGEDSIGWMGYSGTDILLHMVEHELVDRARNRDLPSRIFIDKLNAEDEDPEVRAFDVGPDLGRFRNWRKLKNRPAPHKHKVLYQATRWERYPGAEHTWDYWGRESKKLNLP